jgi:hypothetical protein
MESAARPVRPNAARERLGDLGTVKSECVQLLEEDLRAEARRDSFDDLRQDVRFGWRSGSVRTQRSSAW